MCDISAAESSFFDEAGCADPGDAFVRSDSGNEQTTRAQLRLRHPKTAFVPAGNFGKIIASPFWFKDLLRPILVSDQSEIRPPERIAATRN
jgi:hypothetical protein